MRDGEDRDARLAVRVVEQPADIQRLAFEPRGEGRRGEQAVQRHRQFVAILGREEEFQIDDADPIHRRILDAPDQLGEVEVFAGTPSSAENVGNEDVLAAAHRIGINAEETQKARGREADPIEEEFAILEQCRRRRGEGGEDRHRNAGRRARREDGEIGRFAQTLDPISILSPRGEAVPPQRALLRGEVVGRQILPLRVAFIDPWPEILRPQLREGEEQIAEIALRIDGDRRHAVERGLLDQADAEPGLAAARHADADGMGHEIARIIEEESGLRLPRGEIVGPSEIEGAELFIFRDGGSEPGLG